MVRASSPRWLVTGVLLNRDARWMTPHLCRFAFLAALFFALWSGSQGITRTAAPGLHLLQALTYVSAEGIFLLAVVGASRMFHDEWLGNNLDLLQLTGLNGFDLILARLIPFWLTAVSLLLVQIPCFLLCITLGGVTMLQVYAVVWQLLWVFLIVSGLVILAAARYRRPIAIALFSMGWLFLFYLAALVVDVARNPLLPAVRTGPGMHLNPMVEFPRIFTTGFAGPVLGWPAVVNGIVVAGCLLLSARTVQGRMTRPREELSVDEAIPEGEAHRFLIPVRRPGYQVPRCGINAIEWKDYHFALGGDETMRGKWTYFGFFAPVICLMALPLFARIPGIANGIVFILVILILEPIVILSLIAQRIWVQEIRERTLENLALLPISSRDVILAKLKVIARVALPELLVGALAAAVMTAFLFNEGAPFAVGLLFVVLYLSLPMFVCTDAAWQFLPKSWTGFWPRLKLAGLNLAAWILTGCVAINVSPASGLALLAVVIPVSCYASVTTAAYWLGNRTGELLE